MHSILASAQMAIEYRYTEVDHLINTISPLQWSSTGSVSLWELEDNRG